MYKCVYAHLHTLIVQPQSVFLRDRLNVHLLALWSTILRLQLSCFVDLETNMPLDNPNARIQNVRPCISDVNVRGNGRKLPGRSLFRVRHLSTPATPLSTQSCEREREKETESEGEKAVRIMTRCVSFENDLQTAVQALGRKRVEWAVEWEESLGITGGRSLILALPSILVEFNPLSHICVIFDKKSRVYSIKTLRNDAMDRKISNYKTKCKTIIFMYNTITTCNELHVSFVYILLYIRSFIYRVHTFIYQRINIRITLDIVKY